MGSSGGNNAEGTPPAAMAMATSETSLPTPVKALLPTAVATTANGVSTKAASGGAPPKSSSSGSAMAAPRHSPEPPAKSLVIGEGVLFEGATEGCTAAVVGGRLRGTVKSRRLEVTRVGRMEGTATAETIEIAGAFEGILTATKALKVRTTGDKERDLWGVLHVYLQSIKYKS